MQETVSISDSLRSQEASFGTIPDSMGSFAVRLEFFSGPLDLLLHLVRREEVALEEVEMARIAEQYLEIVERARILDLEIAAEYLVIAATLMAIKSESLLPQTGFGEDGEGLEMGSEFYEELRERLRRYEQVKLQAETFRRRPQLGVDTFPRLAKFRIEVDPESIEVSEDPHSLATFFAKLLKRIGQNAASLRVMLEPISVVQYMMKVLDGVQSFREQVPRTFRHLVSNFIRQEGVDDSLTAEQAEAKGKSTVIGTFVAVLELVKRGVIRVSQPNESADIELSAAVEGDSLEFSQVEREELESLQGNVIPLKAESAGKKSEEEQTAPQESEEAGQLAQAANLRKGG